MGRFVYAVAEWFFSRIGCNEAVHECVLFVASNPYEKSQDHYHPM
ncbi:hypothetical protein [Kineothrix alysoides]|nr:hypothetical protein [Kineothrix alysoides]